MYCVLSINNRAQFRAVLWHFSLFSHFPLPRLQPGVQRRDESQASAAEILTGCHLFTAPHVSFMIAVFIENGLRFGIITIKPFFSQTEMERAPFSRLYRKHTVIGYFLERVPGVCGSLHIDSESSLSLFLPLLQYSKLPRCSPQVRLTGLNRVLSKPYRLL